MNLQSRADYFRCLVYEPVFQNVKNSYILDTFYKHIVLKGGGASGKSEQIGHEINFWLPERVEDEALIITYSQEHKKNTVNRIKRILKQHNYQYIESKGDIIYGNNNRIRFLSLAGKSKAEEKEKLKTFTLENSNSLKFIWFEEFTAIIGLFDNYHEYFYAVSRLFRETRKDTIIFYCYNPLPMKSTHPINEFAKIEAEDKLTIHSTIYDLPKKFQSEQDIKEAEELKRLNPKAWENIYMGLEVSGDNNAFDITDDIYTELSDDYIDYQVFSDEGTVNATTFSLFGFTRAGEIHFITNYYYSSKITGIQKSPEYFANEYIEFIGNLKNSISKNMVDSPYFAVQLREKGIEAQSVHSLKDRPLSYKLLLDMVLRKRFKVVRREENEMLIKQMTNAEKEYNREGLPMISKKYESGNRNEKHTHSLDTCLYMCLVNKADIMLKKGKK